MTPPDFKNEALELQEGPLTTVRDVENALRRCWNARGEADKAIMLSQANLPEGLRGFKLAAEDLRALDVAPEGEKT